MMTRHKPKLVLLGIDFWWFNSQFTSVKYKDHPLPLKPRFQIEYLFEPVSFLFQGKISISQYLKILLHSPVSSTEDQCSIGVSARFTGVGYGPDGSYYYGDMLSGKSPEDTDVEFSDTINRIRTGSNRFEYGEHIDPTHWTHFLNFVHDIEEQGILVVLFFPPLAPTTYREMDHYRDRYGYFTELRQFLRQADLTFYDFEDPSTISSTDCEFVDGFHGGVVANARLLLTIAQKDPRVQPFLNTHVLQQIISQNQGRASIADPRATVNREVDFLGIGCKK